MSTTKIEWATHTSNWLAGCTKVSPACTHCYAETMTRRLASGLGDGQPRYQAGVIDTDTGRWTGRIAYDAEAMRRAFDGLRQARKPRRVFINSMSDTFHYDVPPESLGPQGLAGAIAHAHIAGVGKRGHVIMLLTKRPANLLKWQRAYFSQGLPPWVWVGCTVEDQKRADERVPVLLQVKASVRFLSAEPMLGPVSMEKRRDTPMFNGGTGEEWLPSLWSCWECGGSRYFQTDPYLVHCSHCGGTGRGIHWVICGGESGRKARPMHPAWAQSLRDQCTDAGVPFFFKQWGEWSPSSEREWSEDSTGARYMMVSPDGRIDNSVAGYLLQPPATAMMRRTGKHAAGRQLDGRTWDEVPR